jgi:hypothetical protein
LCKILRKEISELNKSQRMYEKFIWMLKNKSLRVRSVWTNAN